MTQFPVDQLAEATRQRAEHARARARDAIRRMDRDGLTINYATVAKTARVSRSLLYRDPTLRAQINKLRAPGISTRHTPPASQRMSQASRDELLATLRAEVAGLREQNKALRERLATTLGEERADHDRQRHVADHSAQQLRGSTDADSR